MRETVDGLYELFLVKHPDLKLYQGIFNIFPDIQEWSMNDLYSRHPDPAKSFLYMYQGRRDDVIVLNNGEKVVPVLMEATLALILQQGGISTQVNGASRLQSTGQTNGLTKGLAPNQMPNPTTIERMQTILQTHVSSLPHSNRTSPPVPTEQMTVLLSSSTGSLGSYLLDVLYHHKRVSRIICLDRSSNAAERHNQTGPRRGFSPLDPRRVDFLQADLSKQHLGLSATLYVFLRSTVTHFIRK